LILGKLNHFRCFTAKTFSISRAVTHGKTTMSNSNNIKTVPLHREVLVAMPAEEVSEGVGARVRRSIGTSSMKHFTPFLVLDHFKISPDAGFPDHPHRGQETITYLFKGRVDHEDFTGSKGTLEPGDLQFMTAGRGIMHAEMPRIDKEKDGSITSVEGLQLWVDLPADLKDTEPRYRDLRAKEIPIANPDEKVTVKVISGQSYGVDSLKDLAYTPIWMLDFVVKPGGKVKQTIPTGYNSFLYIVDGKAKILGKTYSQYTNVLFRPKGDFVEVEVSENEAEDTRFVLLAGKILQQQIFQYGPFVETTKDKIMQAMDDFQSHKHGFERAEGWKSEIGKRLMKH
jgi:redox-sensitive bicupin YhaK (pirin superfamily)